MIKKIIVFIGSILACIGILILLILSTLLALTRYYANDMQQDFSIKSLEQADIYFSKYLDYAKTVVDEYNPNYELTTEMIMQDEDREKHFSSNFMFNDKFSLYISVKLCILQKDRNNGKPTNKVIIRYR